jgi:iron complex transport system substrate-binding protein
MKKLLLVVIATILAVSLCACQEKAQPVEKPPATPTEQATIEVTNTPEPENVSIADEYKSMVVSQDEKTVTLLDARDREVTIQKNPKKVIPLQNTLLDLWYLAGGSAVARVSGTTSVPEAAMELPEVGKTTAPNVELILANEPDLVILNATTDSHHELEPVLDENKIPYFYTGTSVNPYDSIMKALYTFATIVGNDDASETIDNIDEQVSEIVKKTEGKESPSVLVLFGSSRSVKCEMDNGLVGDMCKRLGAQNIIENVNIEGTTKIDFSLETIVEKDPDYILICVMGKLDGVKDRMAKDIESNEAWASLTAVKEGRVHYLPKDLYMYKPNGRYPEAFQGLFEILYP